MALDSNFQLVKVLHTSQSWVHSVKSDDSIQDYISSRNFIVKTADFLDEIESKGIFGVLGCSYFINLNALQL